MEQEKSSGEPKYHELDIFECLADIEKADKNEPAR